MTQNSQYKIQEKEQSGKTDTTQLEDFLSKATESPLGMMKDAWGRESPETDPRKHSHLIFHIGAKAVPWSKDGFIQQEVLEQLESHLQNTKQNSICKQTLPLSQKLT
jgi:hypothetical protein